MSLKKEPSVRRSVKADVTTAGGAQSAAARRSAEAQLRTLVDKFASDRIRLVGALRRSLQKRLPTAHEVVYEYRDCFVISYSPNEHGYDGILALRGSADDLRLYLNFGKGLPDPEKLLRGSAKQVRWIDVEGTATLARPAVTHLIEAGHLAQPETVRTRRPGFGGHSFD